MEYMMHGTLNGMDTMSDILNDMGTNFEDDLGNVFDYELAIDLENGTGYSPDELGYDENEGEAL